MYIAKVIRLHVLKILYKDGPANVCCCIDTGDKRFEIDFNNVWVNSESETSSLKWSLRPQDFEVGGDNFRCRNTLTVWGLR